VVKVPVKIQISDKGLTIDVEPTKAASAKAAAARAQNSSADDLELRLMSTDDDNESAQMQLTMDLLMFVDKTLRTGDKKELLKFLNSNKHRFSADQKEFLKDAINNAKG